MQDTFTVAQDFSFAEYLRFSYYQLPRMKMVRRLFIFSTAIGLLSGLLGLFALGENEKLGVMLLVQSLMPPVFLFLFFFVFMFLGALFVVRFKPHIIRGITYRFTHWGMERIGTRTEATIPWRDFRSLKETASFYLLHVRENNTDNVHVIQKSKFANSEEAEQFKAFVTGNLAAQ